MPRLPPELVRWERLDYTERFELDTLASRRAVERPPLAQRLRAWLKRVAVAARA